MYQEFDLDNWKRKSAYDYFIEFEDPFFNLCSELDVSKLYSFCKAHQYSFNLAILYYSLKVVNEIEEFRLRILDGKVVLYDIIHGGSTILHEDETFSFCYFDFQEDVHRFIAEGKLRVQAQLEHKVLDPRTNELNAIHYSVIPWISFTSFKHAKKFRTHDSIPKITFGKYFVRDQSYQLPISVAVNHALMDGFHVGKYMSRLQQLLDEIEWEPSSVIS